MAYGIPKISARQLKQEILDLITVEMEKDPALTGDNLSYYGADINFSMSVTLVSRGKSEIKVIAASSVGEANPPQQIAGSEEEGEEAAPAKKVVEVAGRRQIGRKHVAHEDPKNLGKGVESKPEPAQADK